VSIAETQPHRPTAREVGSTGEELAARFLSAKGLTVLERNWRGERGELDIVALDPAGVLAVVEVKTRRGTGFGAPAGAVTAPKYARLRRLAAQWVRAHDYPGTDIRIDVVAVSLGPDGCLGQIEHIEGVFW
jgi:putative endonuclease